MGRKIPNRKKYKRHLARTNFQLYVRTKLLYFLYYISATVISLNFFRRLSSSY